MKGSNLDNWNRDKLEEKYTVMVDESVCHFDTLLS